MPAMRENLSTSNIGSVLPVKMLSGEPRDLGRRCLPTTSRPTIIPKETDLISLHFRFSFYVKILYTSARKRISSTLFIRGRLLVIVCTSPKSKETILLEKAGAIMQAGEASSYDRPSSAGLVQGWRVGRLQADAADFINHMGKPSLWISIE